MIYKIIYEGSQNYFIDDVFFVYNYAIDNKISSFTNNNKLNELREIISKDGYIVNSIFIKVKTLLGYWLVSAFEQQNRDLYIEEDSEVEVNLNYECVNKLMSILNNPEFLSYNYYSIEHQLKEYDVVKFLYELVKSKKLFIEEEKFLESDSEDLISTILIQKLLFQLDNEINLDLEFIKRLIDKIDFSNIHFGEELNTFIKEHRSIIREKNIEIPKKPYRNWISSLEGGFVSQFSYLTQENLVEYDESRVLEILVNAEKEQRGSSFLEEKTINETENFFITVLKESNEISKKVSDLLKNHIDDLYPKYKRLYVKIISFPEIEEDLRKIVREKYLKRFNKESFDSNDRKFFEYHIKQQNTDIDIFEKLLSINVNELSTPKGDNKQLDILHFINSEMGSYFQCLISLFINHSSYRDVIIQIINSVTDTDYREFAQGILLNEYNPNRINVTYNTFLGFAYYHSTITIEAADVFTDVVRDILNKKIEDNQILNKVYLVALERVDPTIESFSLSKNNYSQMINIIFTGDYEFRYSKEWLGALFKFDSSANYLVTIFYLLYNENLKKNRFALFIEELSDYLTIYNQKLSLRGMNYKLNHEELNNFDLLKKMFLKLMETDKIENDIFYLDGIKSILPLLSLDDRRNVLQHIQKQNNCPPPEIEELQRIIVN
ncbi:membrane protein [Streptococcus pneumoniae]|nr:membrane protein [Streptococcus pneumoniae]